LLNYYYTICIALDFTWSCGTSSIPDLANADSAVPLLITSLIPNIVLGLVVVGLLSSQLSNYIRNLNVLLQFCDDVYENVINRKATDKDILKIARLITFIVGIGMILFAYLVPILGGAVMHI